jgi:hypothetical protein
MSAVLRKLNLEDRTEIPVLNATDAFEPKLEDLRGVRVVRRLDVVKGVAFALTFVTRRAGLWQLSKSRLPQRPSAMRCCGLPIRRARRKNAPATSIGTTVGMPCANPDSTACVKSRSTKIGRHSDSGATSSPSGPGSSRAPLHGQADSTCAFRQPCWPNSRRWSLRAQALPAPRPRGRRSASPARSCSTGRRQRSTRRADRRSRRPDVRG